MPRATGGVAAKNRHRKVLKAAKGFRGARGRLYRTAVCAVMKSGQYAYRDRRTKKREFRRLWVVRIDAAARQVGLKYSTLVHGLRKAGVEIDRKVLADMAINDFAGFARIAEVAKGA